MRNRNKHQSPGGPKRDPKRYRNPPKARLMKLMALINSGGSGGLDFFLCFDSWPNLRARDLTGTQSRLRDPQAPLQQHSTNIKSFMSLTPAFSDSIH